MFIQIKFVLSKRETPKTKNARAIVMNNYFKKC